MLEYFAQVWRACAKYVYTFVHARHTCANYVYAIVHVWRACSSYMLVIPALQSRPSFPTGTLGTCPGPPTSRRPPLDCFLLNFNCDKCCNLIKHRCLNVVRNLQTENSTDWGPKGRAQGFITNKIVLWGMAGGPCHFSSVHLLCRICWNKDCTATSMMGIESDIFRWNLLSWSYFNLRYCKVAERGFQVIK